MYALETRHLTKYFGSHKALSDVSIQVEKGKIFGLLGPNGAGKTTLIRIINQITQPNNGEVFFFGQKLKREHIARIGYLPEERGLYRKMKVGDQAMYLARLKGISAANAREQLKYWFKRFDILDWWDKEVETLSKGMAQKIQFVVTVLHKPDLLIFDEPFSGFDPVNANLIRDEILELKENGTTIIFSTHRMESVEQLCEEIALIHKSELLLQSSLRDIRQSYRSLTWEVTMPAHAQVEIPAFATLKNKTEKDGFQHFDIQLSSENELPALIQKLMESGLVLEFKEKIPSLQDIFVEKVTSDTTLNID